MNPYFRVFKLAWQKNLAYRSNVFLMLGVSLLVFLTFYYLWNTIYINKSSIDNFSRAEMLTYAMGGIFLAATLVFRASGDTINRDIIRGNLNQFLTKPLSALWNWFLLDLSRLFFGMFSAGAGLLTILLFFKNSFVAPISLNAFWLTITMILLAHIIMYQLTAVLALLAFWIGDTWSIRFGVRVLTEFGAGAFVPLTFFTPLVQKFFLTLPLKFVAFVPMKIYLGQIVGINLIKTFSEAIIWAVSLTILAVFIWKQGLKHYEGAGI